MASTEKTRRQLDAARSKLMDRLERLDHPFHNLPHARTRAIVIAEMIKSLQLHEKEDFDLEKTDLLVDCVFFSLLGYCESPVKGVTREQQSFAAVKSLFTGLIKGKAMASIERTLLVRPFSDSTLADAESDSPARRRMLTVSHKIFLLSDNYAFLHGWDAFVEERLRAYAEGCANEACSADDFLDTQRRLVDDYLRPMVVAMEHKWESDYRRSLLTALDDIGARIASTRNSETERNALEARLQVIEAPVPV
jgi:hypothetical protein